MKSIYLVILCAAFGVAVASGNWSDTILRNQTIAMVMNTAQVILLIVLILMAFLGLKTAVATKQSMNDLLNYFRKLNAKDADRR